MLKLNLGSGQRKFGPGWTNVDCQEKWNPDVVANGLNMPMFGDASADMVVIHHVIEHLWADHAIGMARECHRILAPGGRLIVCVPDIRALVRAWVTGRMSHQIFFTNLYGAFMGDEADRHKWGYVMETLAETLEHAAGWQTIGRFDFRHIPGAAIANDWWILGMEAVK